MGARVKRALRYVIAGSVQQANTDLGIALQCHLVMSCDEFKADNAKLADSKCLPNESALSQTYSKVAFHP